MTSLDNNFDVKEVEIVSFNKNLDSQEESEPACFVAVHIGAGYHSLSKTGSYRYLCEQVCSEVIKLLKEGYKARAAVATAVALLENSPLTNAGLGSNLTLDEKVECDASIMDDSGFGSVGAISNIKNPILVSLSLLEAQAKGTLSFGRIVPCMLVGEGAKKWAIDNNLEQVDDEYLKTESMIKSHRHYKEKLDSLDQVNENNNIKNEKNNEAKRLDTVGAIVLDRYGNIASAVSSGGILLKHPGRVGHASMFGCGCWVEQDVKLDNTEEKHSIGICTTGCGEYIIKTLFAKECAAHILRNTDHVDYKLNDFFKKYFFQSPLLRNLSDKLIGALICKLHEWNDENGKNNKSLELIVAHTTPSIGFGYMSSNMHAPCSVMSRMKEENASAETVMITNFNFNFNNINKESSNLNSEEDEELSHNKKRKFAD